MRAWSMDASSHLSAPWLLESQSSAPPKGAGSVLRLCAYPFALAAPHAHRGRYGNLVPCEALRAADNTLFRRAMNGCRPAIIDAQLAIDVYRPSIDDRKLAEALQACTGACHLAQGLRQLRRLASAPAWPQSRTGGRLSASLPDIPRR